MPTTYKVAPDPALVNVEPSIEELLKIVRDAIEDKKGEQPVILDLSGVVDYLDYLVICSGSTEIQNRAISENIIDALGRYGIVPDAVNGSSGGQWVLLDYGVIVIHVFLSRLREYYRLEELWAGGNEVKV